MARYDERYPSATPHDRGSAEYGYRKAIENLEAAGFRIIHPALMREDCADPWVCCIHDRPKD